MTTTQYSPGSVSPPGATLQDLLEERGISQADLALRLDRSKKNISEIVNGKAPITSELALALEQTLGTPARFWISREAIYRESLARAAQPEPTEDDLEWARAFPYSEMVRLGWIPATSKIKEKFYNLLRFFGVVNPQAFKALWLESAQARFRCSQALNAKPFLIAAWMRQGEKQAEAIPTQPYSESRFKDAVRQARALTNLELEEFLPRIQDSFAACGVVLLFVRELKSMGISGATRWVTSDRALIQMTLRYRTNDHLWFTLFHECFHILKHSKKEVFLEYNKKDDQEREADKLACDLLIPPSELERFRAGGRYSPAEIRAFANRIGIAPGIVVGRLQHDEILRFDQCNDLKIRYGWKEVRQPEATTREVNCKR